MWWLISTKKIILNDFIWLLQLIIINKRSNKNITLLTCLRQSFICRYLERDTLPSGSLFDFQPSACFYCHLLLDWSCCLCRVDSIAGPDLVFGGRWNRPCSDWLRSSFLHAHDTLWSLLESRPWKIMFDNSRAAINLLSEPKFIQTLNWQKSKSDNDLRYIKIWAFKIFQ